MSSSASSAGFGVKRRWDSDSIFKNQAHGVDEKKTAVFLNDVGRSVRLSRLARSCSLTLWVRC